jgi:HEAT repeat protein
MPFLEDPDEEVQLHSTRAILLSDHPRKDELAIRQLLSPHESVRKLAAREVAKTSFTAYMRAFNAIDNKTRVLAASALIKISGSLEGDLKEALAAKDIDTKIKALKIFTMAGPHERLEPEIILLASHPDPHLRATAIIALSAFESRESEQAVIKALRDTDERVAANAVEALETRGNPGCVPAVKQLEASRVARVRANVVKCLFRFGDQDYRGLFFGMCEHGDRSMNASAIWLASHLGMPEAAEGMKMILGGRADGHIKERAASALEQIEKANDNPKPAEKE